MRKGEETRTSYKRRRATPKDTAERQSAAEHWRTPRALQSTTERQSAAERYRATGADEGTEMEGGDVMQEFNMTLRNPTSPLLWS